MYYELVIDVKLVKQKSIIQIKFSAVNRLIILLAEFFYNRSKVLSIQKPRSNNQ